MTTVSLPPATPDAADFGAACDHAVVSELASLAIIAVDGHDAATFLQGQLSSDILGLSAESCEYSSYNSPAGRVLANLLVFRAGPNTGDGFRMLLSADLAASVLKRLSMFVLRAKVSLSDVSPASALFGIGGPRARDAVRGAFRNAPAPFAVTHQASVAVLGVHGPRYIVVAPTAEASATSKTLAAHARPVAIDVWRWLAIRSGVPLVTEPTRDKFVAQTLNWDVLGGVNFQKGCYTGQEIIARTQYLGRLKERLFALASSEPLVRPGDRLYSAEFGDQACGTVVNVAAAPQGGCEMLAVLQLAAAASGDVRLAALDGPRLTLLALPYPIPEAAASRQRVS